MHHMFASRSIMSYGEYFVQTLVFDVLKTSQISSDSRLLTASYSVVDSIILIADAEISRQDST